MPQILLSAWHLLRHSTASLVGGWMGTTLLALIVGGIRHFIPPCIDALISKSPVKWKKLTWGDVITVVGAWAFLLALSIVQTIYTDHRYWVTKSQDLETQLPSKDAEISTLKAKLDATCYQPDRRITEEQHDILYRSLSKLAKATKDKRLTLVYAAGDLETARYTSSLFYLFKNAGWYISEPTPVQMPTKAGDKQPLGFLGHVSITEEMDESTSEGKERRRTALTIVQAFSDAKLDMMGFPVGETGNPTRPQRMTIWVCPKPAN
jgi:hypothetical protein